MARGTFRGRTVSWQSLQDVDDDFPDVDPINYNRLILCEGDSWFSIGDFPSSNVLFELFFSESTMLVNLAFPGDTIAGVSKLAKNRDLDEALASQSIHWNCILLSGGGNDVLDQAEKFLLSPEQRAGNTISGPEDYCSSIEFDKILAVVSKGYTSIAAKRPTMFGSNKLVPIVTHTYDYVTPRNSPARFSGIGIVGPWIYKAFVAKQVPTQHRLALAKYIIDRLAENHLSLQQTIDEFYVVDTRGKLNPASLETHGEDQDWINEFHPNGAGYTKIAKALEPVIERLLKA